MIGRRKRKFLGDWPDWYNALKYGRDVHVCGVEGVSDEWHSVEALCWKLQPQGPWKLKPLPELWVKLDGLDGWWQARQLHVRGDR